MCSLGSFELLELCWKVWVIVFCDFNSSVWKPILKHICFHSLLSTHSFHRCRMCIDSLHMTLKSECITSTFMQKSVHLERELSTFPSTVLGAIGSWVLFTLLDSSFLPLSLSLSVSNTHTHTSGLNVLLEDYEHNPTEQLAIWAIRWVYAPTVDEDRNFVWSVVWFTYQKGIFLMICGLILWIFYRNILSFCVFSWYHIQNLITSHVLDP